MRYLIPILFLSGCVLPATPTPVVSSTPTSVVPVVTPTVKPVPSPTQTPGSGIVTNPTPTPVVSHTPTPVVSHTPTPVVSHTPTPVVSHTPTPTPMISGLPVSIGTKVPFPVVSTLPAMVIPVAGVDESCAGLNLDVYPQDSNGWTILPSLTQAGRRVIYVGAKNPAPVMTPVPADTALGPFYVQTAEQGISLLRKSSPDSLLFNKGETFVLKTTMSLSNGRGDGGPTPALAKVIGAYGTGARPVLTTPTAGGLISMQAGDFNNVILSSLDLEKSPTLSIQYNGVIIMPVKGSNILLEDMKINGFSDNLVAQLYKATGPTTNLTIRRSEITGACGAFRSQGAFIEGITGLTIDENFMDQNGLEICGVPTSGSPQAQNLYIYSDNKCFRLRGNVISRALGAGVEARAGGTIQGNVFLSSSTSINFGLVLGGEQESKNVPQGVSGQVTGNVIYGPSGGVGIQFANLKSGLVGQNIVIGAPTSHLSAFTYNPNIGIGIHNLKVSGNIVYGAEYGMTANGSNYSDNVLENDGINDLIVAYSHGSWMGGIQYYVNEQTGLATTFPIFQFEQKYPKYTTFYPEGYEMSGGDLYSLSGVKVASSGETGIFYPTGIAPIKILGGNTISGNQFQQLWAVPFYSFGPSQPTFLGYNTLSGNQFSCTTASKCPAPWGQTVTGFVNPAFSYPTSLYAAMAVQSKDSWNANIMADVLIAQAQAAFAPGKLLLKHKKRKLHKK